MNNNYSHISIVLDTSGSMVSCKTDAEGGLNHFINKQKEFDGKTTITLAEFSNRVNYRYYFKNIKDLDGLVSIYPSGGTALLDAIGKTVVDTGASLKLLPENERPSSVIMVIVTDGEENSSKEFSQAKIRDMIKHQTDVYNWQFIYLGANQDAFKVANNLNISGMHTASYDTTNFAQTWAANNNLIGRMRSAGACGQSMRACSYKDEERKAMTNDTVSVDYSVQK